MKSITIKLITFSVAFLFAVGCATVTDANLDLPEEDQPSFETSENVGTLWDTRNGDDMNPIIERPKTGGGALD